MDSNVWSGTPASARSVMIVWRRSWNRNLGIYTNFDEESLPTGGTIELIQRSDGSFATVGRHADGQVDWEGTLMMSLDPLNVGLGMYTHASTPTDFGEQRVRYIPELQALHVFGANTSATAGVKFVHTWRRKG